MGWLLGCLAHPVTMVSFFFFCRFLCYLVCSLSLIESQGDAPAASKDGAKKEKQAPSVVLTPDQVSPEVRGWKWSTGLCEMASRCSAFASSCGVFSIFLFGDRCLIILGRHQHSLPRPRQLRNLVLEAVEELFRQTNAAAAGNPIPESELRFSAKGRLLGDSVSVASGCGLKNAKTRILNRQRVHTHARALPHTPIPLGSGNDFSSPPPSSVFCSLPHRRAERVNQNGGGIGSDDPRRQREPRIHHQGRRPETELQPWCRGRARGWPQRRGRRQ